MKNQNGILPISLPIHLTDYVWIAILQTLSAELSNHGEIDYAVSDCIIWFEEFM